jgi:F-type H+-transporting ATPase subunit b
MLATALILATEAGAEEGGGGLDAVLPALPELVWGAVAFLLLYLVLQKKAFPQLNAMLAQRQASIQGQLEEAERVRVEAEQLRRQYNEQIADARNQANTIIDEARAQADRLRADIVAKAEEEAQQIVNRSREDVEAERGRLVQDLRGQVAALSVELAGKIVQKELDPSQHQALVDQYINELSGLN